MFRVFIVIQISQTILTKIGYFEDVKSQTEDHKVEERTLQQNDIKKTDNENWICWCISKIYSIRNYIFH